MKRTSKFLSFILALVMVISIIPMSTITASAATSGTCGSSSIGDVYWNFDENTGTLTITGDASMDDYHYPTEDDYYGEFNPAPWYDFREDIRYVDIDYVWTIGAYAFYDCVNIVEISLPNSLSWYPEYGGIGQYAFENCTSLTNITIPDGVTGIGFNAFKNCTSIQNITIPDSVTAIGFNAFKNCTSLQNITIPDGVTEIGSHTFENCTSLTNIAIPDSVTTIDEYAFSNCYNLASITIGNSVTIINEFAFYYCRSLTNVIIPDSVTRIVSNAFWGCDGLTDIIIGSNVNYIGNGSFNNYYSNLTSITVDSDNQYFSSDEYGVLFNKNKTTLIQHPTGNTRTNYTIPDSVTTIGDYAFEFCSNLTSITIPKSITTIGRCAFLDCNNLTDVYYLGTEEDWNVISVVNGNDQLLNATIHYANPTGTCGENLTWEFDESTGTLTISGVGEMSDFTEESIPWKNYKYDIKTVIINNGVTTIGDYAFRYCDSLTNVTIPDSVTSIGDSAFSYCNSLKSITIPDSVKMISFCLFWGCESLTSIVIPDSITTIDDYAFYDCENLDKVYYEGKESQWKEIYIWKFNDCLLNATIYYNGIDPSKFTGIKGDYFYKNDVILKAYQLVEFEGDFYYIGDRHEIVKNKKVYIKAERTNDLTFADGTPITAGWYDFDTDGKMIILDGIVGNKVYKNNVQLKAYQLVEVDGDFYYIGDCHEIVKNKKVYIKADRVEGFVYPDDTPLQAGYYEFDENGKMIILDGIVGNKIYKNNIQLKAYQLVEVDGDFYYIADRHEIVKNNRVYIKSERLNGLTYADGTPLTAGYYDFDENGKMIILDGIVGNKIYKNGVQLKAYQLVEVNGDFYYIGDRHEIVKDKKVFIKAERTNGLTFADGTPIQAEWYNFDADGKMIMQ